MLSLLIALEPRLGTQVPSSTVCQPRDDELAPLRPRADCRLALIRQRWREDGGAERQVHSVLECLSGQFDVTLISRSWRADLGVKVLRCDPPRVGRLGREWGFAREVRHLLRNHDFDLVQSHERIAGCDIYRAGDGVHREWLRQRARTQTVWARWMSAISPFHTYQRQAEKQLFASPRLRAVVCNSRMVRNEIVYWFQTNPDKLRVVYNGVDAQRFHPDCRRHRSEVRRRLWIPDAATVFVFVGSGFDRKGLGAALEALARTAGAFLIVVGKDKRPEQYRRLARCLGVGDRVRFVGPQSDVCPYYGAADALLMPALYEPFGNVVLEAMAVGLPVVTSAKNGAAEVVIAGDSGFVCDALDIHGISAAMRQLSDAGLREQLGRHARAVAESMSREHMSRQLVGLYAELLEERGVKR